MLQPDLGTSLVLAGDPRRHAVHVRGEPRWLGAIAAAVIAALPFVWNNVLRDYQKQRILTASSTRRRDVQGPGCQLYQSQIAVGSGGLSAKA